MKQIDLNFYPGWVRKAITFTIDDGNINLDRKFLAITEPAGLRGTFNLNPPLWRGTFEDYRAFYRDYEISNHCKYHPFAFTEKTTRPIKDEPFDEATADPAFAYPTGETDGLYWFASSNSGKWRRVATDECYLRMVDEGQKELEAAFPDKKIRGFVWPFGEQHNQAVFDGIAARGFGSMRKAGCVLDSTGFALPADRYHWSYNANYLEMEESAKKYEEYPDDGTLKFYCFGVHSHDFENADRWDVLEDFCARYGNRPEDFWYASVGEIFDYEDAVKAVTVTESKIVNHSDMDLYIKIDGVRKTLHANATIQIG